MRSREAQPNAEADRRRHLGCATRVAGGTSARPHTPLRGRLTLGHEMPLDPQLPLWLKVAYSAFVGFLVPVYWAKNGPANFLWFSDIALLLAVPALWLEHRLLSSTLAISVLFLELMWLVSFLSTLTLGKDPIGIADYMVDPTTPGVVKLLSGIFHVGMPATLLWMVAVLGYDRRALVVQTLLAWVVLPVTYAFTDPAKNINWVFSPGPRHTSTLPPLVYLALLMAGLPVFVYWPTHVILQRLFGR